MHAVSKNCVKRSRNGSIKIIFFINCISVNPIRMRGVNLPHMTEIVHNFRAQKYMMPKPSELSN